MTDAAVLRHLPSIDALLQHPDVGALAGVLPRDVVVDLAREELARLRRGVLEGTVPVDRGRDGLTGAAVATVLARAAQLRRPRLRRVVNATGVVLHTNLGRAPLSRAAIDAITAATAGYTNLEIDLDTGERGSRHDHLEELICRVTGAEAALAVNNNAAALLLVLSEIARGREVIVSRGQAVEIGGGFRIPDVMAQSGARIVEVGTTNRTRVDDYERAVGPDTAALLHVHTSNFRLVGFHLSADLPSLARLAKDRGVLLVDDQGSGCVLDTVRFGVPVPLREPLVQESVAAGVDVVCFSGDKLLGGPQAGIIAGRGALVARLKRHPLARALRLDKDRIAGLSATLLHYVCGEAEREVPVWQMIGAPLPALERRARRWAARLRAAGVRAASRHDQSPIGGGSLPGVTLPTAVVVVEPPAGTSAGALAAALRGSDPPVVGRIDDERLVLDPRTVLAGDEPALLAALVRVARDAGIPDSS